MSRLYSHVNTAKTILKLFKGEMPLSAFLKTFFAREKKFGSSDRRTISAICYNYFRLGMSLKEKSIEEKIVTSLFLLTGTPNDVLQNERSQWNENVSQPLTKKIELATFDTENVFPFNGELSPSVDVKKFNASFLIQPDVFIRIRPGKHDAVKKKLIDSAIVFKEVDGNCFAFANGTKLEDLIDLDREAIIQDFNSQKVGAFFPATTLNKLEVWDCCAASGGKSIMSYDLIQNIHLTVSDLRQTIIQNLHDRFKKAGIKDYNYFVADVTEPTNLQSSLGSTSFDLVICDAPCSGSGTWSRTPEQLLFFKKEALMRYSNLQKNIVLNAIPYVKKGGYFLYITCSVFQKENEEVVEFIQHQTNLQLIKMELLEGYEQKADSMFAALFAVSP